MATTTTPEPATTSKPVPAAAPVPAGMTAPVPATAESTLVARVLGDTGALGRRIPQLFAGLALYGASMALMLRSGLGLDPWDVLHQGLQRSIGLSVGTWVTICGALVLLLWIPLRQRPGLGTVANVLVIGAAMDLTLRFVGDLPDLPVRIAGAVAAITLNGLATGLYIGARLGPGPRDGLMTGLHRRTGRSLRLIRTGIELAVLAVGLLLGGTAGIGTVAYALAIGPLVQFFLPWCTVPVPSRNSRKE
ncbi:putative membrane protein YczE [Streptomyces sp. 1114.5]|uniref:membrane protein YczE n=1 Tax=Streptomyces sp. 1114.5 TaxID=1938830 RepID=UPI000F19E9C7|nr:putative membrane protein YczE [Streptomyces sp. 1114.5]